jgi:hypothetical protein
VFDNTVLRKIFGRMRDEVTDEWRRLRNDELCGVNSSECFSDDKIQKNEMGETCSTRGKGEVHTEFWWGVLKKKATWRI